MCEGGEQVSLIFILYFGLVTLEVSTFHQNFYVFKILKLQKSAGCFFIFHIYDKVNQCTSLLQQIWVHIKVPVNLVGFNDIFNLAL